MHPPFPGMDPWLEHPALWPDVHHRLIGAIADALGPQVAPRYYVALERRTYRMTAGELAVLGLPDVGVVRQPRDVREPRPSYGVAIVDVEVPMTHEVGESRLTVRATGTHEVVTVVEILSPANKLHARGRSAYEQKRDEVFSSGSSLIEIDLLRAGEPMPLQGAGDVRTTCDYRILVSRATERPRAQLYAFGVRQRIPAIPVPLRQGEAEPLLMLNELLHAIWRRGRFDLQLDYAEPPLPPLGAADAQWAAACVARLEPRRRRAKAADA